MMQIQQLSLSRGDKRLFAELSMQAKAGEVVVILGPNGAGKSTLLLALAGLHAADSGDVRYHGTSMAACSKHELAQLIAWQGELPPTEFGLTVRQRLELAANATSATAADIDVALTHMQLQALAGRSLGALSSGERQRAEIAAVMVRDCPVLLLDEPTAHLDMRHQVDCLKLIRREARHGRLVFSVLHDLQHAAAVADTVVLLDGKGGICVGKALEMLTAERLAPVFGVSLQGSGRDLRPLYREYDEEA